MKRIWKWASVLCGFLFCLFLCSTEARAQQFTVSPNGAWVDGSAGNGETNYYAFAIPSAGGVQITYQSFMQDGRCLLFDKDQTKDYGGAYVNGSDTSPGTANLRYNLEAGVYKLSAGHNWIGPIKYRFRISFIPAGNNETEPNNTFQTAMPLPGGTTVTGFLSLDDDIDFYAITLPEGVTVRTTVNRSAGTLGWYYFSIWNSDLIEVGSYNSRDDTRVWEKYLDAGTYYIKISRDGNSTGVYTLKWDTFQYIKSLTLKQEKMAVGRGKTFRLLQSIAPANATNQALTWTSSNTDVATVDSSGMVHAKNVGSATIKAETRDGSKISKTCQIAVTPKKTRIIQIKRRRDRNVLVRVKRQKNVSGIQYQMSRTKTFRGRTSSYYAGGTESKATTAALGRNRRYYFRARMYVDSYGTRYFGPWSKVKSIRTKSRTSAYGYYSWKAI